jgi:excisionase family DNA binding protein
VQAETTIPQGLMTVAETARYLRISERKLCLMYSGGDFPVIRMGRRVLVDAADLAAYLQQHKTGHAAGVVA